MKKIQIYTDGACSGNPGPGGWGAVMIYKNIDKEISGYDLDTTNNKMELKAAIESLKLLKERCKIDLYTDSIYVQKGITEWIHNWIKKGQLYNPNSKIKNTELWQELYSLTNKHDVNWHWVKGHSDNHGNIRADALAVTARKKAEEERNVSR